MIAALALAALLAWVPPPDTGGTRLTEDQAVAAFTEFARTEAGGEIFHVACSPLTTESPDWLCYGATLDFYNGGPILVATVGHDAETGEIRVLSHGQAHIDITDTDATPTEPSASLMAPLQVGNATVQAIGMTVENGEARLTIHIDNTTEDVPVGVFCETLVYGGTQYEGHHGGDDVFPGAAVDIEVWFEGLPPGTTNVSGGTAYCVAHDEDFSLIPEFTVSIP